MVFIKPPVGLALLFLSMSIVAPAQAKTSIDQIESEDGSAREIVQATDLELGQRIIHQLRVLDQRLEDIGLAVNCKVAKVEDRKVVAAHILDLREILARYIGAHAPAIQRGHSESASLRTLLDVETGMLAYVTAAVNNGFTSMDEFDEGMLVKRHRLDTAINAEEMQATLDEFEEQIRCLDKAIKHIGYSLINRTARRISHYNKKTQFSKIFARSLPYVGLGLYLAWATDQLPEWGPLKPLRNLLKKDEPENNSYAAEPGFMNKVHRGLKKVITFGAGHKKEEIAIFNIAGGALLAPILQKDISDLSEWLGEQAGKAKAALQGKPYEDGKPIKLPKITMKDVVGAEHPKKALGRIVDYLKRRANHDRAGAYIDRGYFLVGPLDTSKSLAYAIAGDVNAFYKEKKKSSEMSVYEIHSSELIKKELKAIVKEASEKSPCIVLIEDLDWLHAQQRVDAKVWSDLASTMGSVLTSKKQVFVIATARDASAMASHHKGHLGMVVHVNYPTYEERAEFFKREFEKRGILVARFDLAALARETKQSTFAQITTIINRALNMAHTKAEILAQEHLEDAVNEVAHGIVIKTPEEHERKLLATYYAGKVVAHKLLLPEEPLKVTIYPVIQAGKESAGALISHTPTTAQTDEMIEKACVIDLAGAAAQRLLTGTESQQITHPHLVQESLKKITFNGIDEEHLSQESREQRLQKAEAALATCNKQATRLIRENERVLRNLTKTLEEKLTLNDKEIEECLAQERG